jgi:hypothetical protein
MSAAWAYCGYIGDGAASATELNAPAGVAVDAVGSLYIADTKNQRVRMISGGQIATIAGTGTAGAAGDGGTSALATVSSPLAVALDSTGNLYIADTGNNKVRGINVGMNSLTFATVNPGETSAAQIVSLFDSGNQPLSLTSVSVPAGYRTGERQRHQLHVHSARPADDCRWRQLLPEHGILAARRRRL